MARIRSIHPGLFTDDDFMALTVDEPLCVPLLIGLWCEADDNGVFAWKPITIKARVLPAVNTDISGLLSKLEEHRFIARFNVDGKEYGAIRNFRVWQRPQKPNQQHPLPDEYRKWVGLAPVDTGAVSDQYDTDTGIPPQRYEVGGRREDVGTPPVVPLTGGHAPAEDQTPSPPAKQPRRKPKRPLPDGWEPDYRVALREGRGEEWGRRRLEQMRNWAAAEDARKADWQRTFDNWCLRDIEREDRRTTGPPPGYADPDEVDRLLEEKARAH